MSSAPKVDSSVDSKVEWVRGELRSLGSAVVAFSGGADSAFVLKLALEELGERVVALTAVSPSLASEELEAAKEVGRRLGARHLVVDSRELEDPDYVRNAPNRCYFCKRELYSICERTREALGFASVLDGFNADDRRDHRPGATAARERGVRSLLAEAELTKAEVRERSRALGLSTWDKPAMPCLASRLPYGTEVTPERLRQVEGAEGALRALGFKVFRVRHHGELARIELAADEHDRLGEPTLHSAMSAALRREGFRFVTVDLEPFRSGRMNDGLPLHAPIPGGVTPQTGNALPKAPRTP